MPHRAAAVPRFFGPPDPNRSNSRNPLQQPVSNHCRPVDAELAREIREFRSPTDGETRMFYEIVIAPGWGELPWLCPAWHIPLGPWPLSFAALPGCPAALELLCPAALPDSLYATAWVRLPAATPRRAWRCSRARARR